MTCPTSWRTARHLLCLTSLLAVAVAGASSPSTPSPTDEPGWFMSGGGRDVYGVTSDSHVTREDHPTIRLEPLPHPPKYGTWMRAVDAAEYRGTRIRVSAFTRTEGATARVDFWARVQAADSPGDGTGLGGLFMRLSSDQPWERKEIVIDVPPEAFSIHYGVGLAGPGRIWIDEPTLEIVGSDVPLSAGVRTTPSASQ